MTKDLLERESLTVRKFFIPRVRRMSQRGLKISAFLPLQTSSFMTVYLTRLIPVACLSSIEFGAPLLRSIPHSL